MKNLFLLLFLFVICVSCNNKTKETVTAAPAVTLPFPISYSSEFEIGDPKFAQSVLEISKDYDNNSLQNSISKFADTFEFRLADGSLLKGQRDSVMAAVISARSSLISATDHFYSVVVLKPKGKEETWVSFWEKEVDVMKDGKKDSTYIDESWKFNTAGKITGVYQFAAK